MHGMNNIKYGVTVFNTPKSWPEIIRIILCQDASYNDDSLRGLLDVIHTNSTITPFHVEFLQLPFYLTFHIHYLIQPHITHSAHNL
jgi:hypothetical protein